MENNINKKIKILNIEQAKYYINNDIKPLDIFIGKGGKIVFEFNRNDTTEVFDKWCKICQKYNREK